MKVVKWTGFGIREAHGYTWESGQEIPIEDDEIADDLLTQPGENFEDVTPAEKGEPVVNIIELTPPPTRRKKKEQEEINSE